MSLNASKKKLDTKKPKSLVNIKKENEKNHSVEESLRSHGKRNIITSRQQEVLKLLADGMSNRQIADILKVTVRAIEAHRAAIMTRLQIYNLPGLVKYAIRTGLTSTEIILTQTEITYLLCN